MTLRTELGLWIAQRASAAVLAIAVAIHLAVVVWAVRGGLDAGEILARTRGATGWFAFYLVFLAAVAVHSAIGLRVVAAEWLGWRGRGADLAAIAWAAMLALLGLRALWGLYA